MAVSSSHREQPPLIIVVGAGIIGASIAWRLAEAGAGVTVVDAQAPRGGIATRSSWAWINASFGNPEPYFRLRYESMQDWHRLAAAIEPHLVSLSEMAIHVAEEGVAEPLATVLAILAATERLGATVVGHRRVRALICTGRRVTGVETESGTLHADEVVVAGGVRSADLLPTAGAVLPMQTAPAIVRKGDLLTLVADPGDSRA